MMLPGNRPTTSSTPVIVQMPLPTPPATATVDDDSTAHADYNLRPLEVRSLDHYMEHDDDERFHIR
jgi:hypothetical protein